MEQSTLLEQWMAKNGKTYVDLAAHLKCPPPVAHRYMKGKRTPRDPKTLQEIVEFANGELEIIDILRGVVASDADVRVSTLTAATGIAGV